MFEDIFKFFTKENYKSSGKMMAPKPNLGDCINTGEWKNPSMVDDCVKCVENPGYYGENQFYCGGKCMSEYDTAHRCSTKSLVAKTIGQCSAPCVQVSAPSLGGCSDKFDCGNGMNCVRGMCVPKTNEQYGDYDYALNMASTKSGFYGKDKLHIGVL